MLGGYTCGAMMVRLDTAGSAVNSLKNLVGLDAPGGNPSVWKPALSPVMRPALSRATSAPAVPPMEGLHSRPPLTVSGTMLHVLVHYHYGKRGKMRDASSKNAPFHYA